MANAENRLGREKSPYLLQHAKNPVDWYAWGEDAFLKAQKEDKPVILSIGYSTCHWCHVMEEESFENADTARLMNEHFVSVKVDREERPDIDSLYMQYVMATTGGGGWPMTVFLTPDKKPFYGGTYFPPEDRYGRPGFKTLLKSIDEAWKGRRQEILDSADSARDFLNRRKETAANPELTESALERAFEHFSKNFDSRFGGFGQAPKFPMGHSISFLLRYHKRSKDAHALEMAASSLIAMADGGLYDQLGGGFHRYSTDRQWRIPHFEKMLYDQAILVKTYLEAYQASREERFAQTARETLDYVLREMTDAQGGFYSAQDADSLDAESGKKREGAFYVWKRSEVEAILGKDAGEFCAAFGIEEHGNALQDPHQEFTDKNVLYLNENKGLTEIKKWEIQKKKLFEVRLKRPKPHLDDKVLADWNGLMIAAFAFASSVLGETRYRSAAERSADFILKKMLTAEGKLLHRYRDGESAIPAGLEDYAFLIYGLLHLYEATFDERWLEESKRLFTVLEEEFWDKEDKGFFLVSEKSNDLIARPKTDYDGAVPSGNSVAALAALLLGRFTGESRYEEFANDIFKAFSPDVASQPTGYSQMLAALDFAVGPSCEIIFASPARDEAFEAMRREIYLRFIPNKITLWDKIGKEKTAVDGKTTAYVCKNRACRLPVTDVRAFSQLLDGDTL